MGQKPLVVLSVIWSLAAVALIGLGGVVFLVGVRHVGAESVAVVVAFASPAVGALASMLTHTQTSPPEPPDVKP